MSKKEKGKKETKAASPSKKPVKTTAKKPTSAKKVAPTRSTSIEKKLSEKTPSSSVKSKISSAEPKPKKNEMPQGTRTYANFIASLSPQKILTAEGWKRIVAPSKKKDFSS